MKSGYKTTEFWVAAVAALATALINAEVFAPGSTAAKVVSAVVATITSLGYMKSRTEVKKAQ